MRFNTTLHAQLEDALTHLQQLAALHSQIQELAKTVLCFGWVGHPWIAPATFRQWRATTRDANHFN